VNFLFHRHLAARDSGSPLAGFGAMLPDLWRMADRRLRPRRSADWPALPAPAARVGEAAKLRALLWGIEHHLAVDTAFHRGEVLKQGEAIATRLLREAAIGGEKVLLFGHVAWEICLDGALLRRLGLEPTKEQLRAELAALGPEALAAALRHHAPELSEAERREAGESLIGMLHQLAWGGWIDGYLDGRGIAQRLEGVRRRVRLPPLGEEDRRRTAEAIDRLLREADDRLDAALALRVGPADSYSLG